MKDEIIDLTAIDQKINALLYKAGYYLQTYRAIDALNVLAEAHRMMDGQEVHWRVRTAVLKNTGQAYIQMGQFENGLGCFAQSYDIIDDGDDKAAAAGLLDQQLWQLEHCPGRRGGRSSLHRAPVPGLPA